jgi:hypothetical protein
MLTFLLILGAAQAPAAPAQPTEKPICRREVPLGSNMTRKICHTKAEWAQIDAANAGNSERALSQRVNRPGAQ